MYNITTVLVLLESMAGSSAHIAPFPCACLRNGKHAVASECFKLGGVVPIHGETREKVLFQLLKLCYW